MRRVAQASVGLLDGGPELRLSAGWIGAEPNDGEAAVGEGDDFRGAIIVEAGDGEIGDGAAVGGANVDHHVAVGRRVRAFIDDDEAARGCSSMVERQLPKLHTRVRFPSPAPFLVFFGYTHCPDVCPTALFEMSEVLRALGEDKKISALFITVDPERDTAKIINDYVSSFDKRIIGLSGPRPDIDAVIKAFRVYARKVPDEKGGPDYAMDHTAIVYLMDKQGRFVGAFNMSRPPAEAAKDLAKYL
jgi:cytochrome oxidase Cu insertion factor (SCO1/SenC/PrrC family)